MTFLCAVCTKLCGVLPPLNDKKVTVIVCPKCMLSAIVASMPKDDPPKEGGDNGAN